MRCRRRVPTGEEEIQDRDRVVQIHSAVVIDIRSIDAEWRASPGEQVFQNKNGIPDVDRDLRFAAFLKRLKAASTLLKLGGFHADSAPRHSKGLHTGA